MEPLEVAIALKGDSPTPSKRSRRAEPRGRLLPRPAGRTDATAQQGSESDLLHFTIHDAQGSERVMLPSSPNRRSCGRRWRASRLAESHGAPGSGEALLAHVHPDVIIVINPWSRLEYQLPRPRTPAEGADVIGGFSSAIEGRSLISGPEKAAALMARARWLEGVHAVETGGGGDEGRFTSMRTTEPGSHRSMRGSHRPDRRPSTRTGDRDLGGQDGPPGEDADSHPARAPVTPGQGVRARTIRSTSSALRADQSRRPSSRVSRAAYVTPSSSCGAATAIRGPGRRAPPPAPRPGTARVAVRPDAVTSASTAAPARVDRAGIQSRLHPHDADTGGGSPARIARAIGAAPRQREATRRGR